MSMRVWSHEKYMNLQVAAKKGYHEDMQRKEFAKTLPIPSRTATPEDGHHLRDGKKVTHRMQKTWDRMERETEGMLRRARGRKERKREVEDMKFKKMLEAFDAEEEIKGITSEYCDLRDAQKVRNKSKLCAEWHHQVYNPMNNEIQRKLARVPVSDLERRHRQHMQQYLDTCNRKPHGVYRDIILEREYNPLKHRTKYIKINRAKYDAADPLHRDVTQIQHEENLIRQIDPNAQILDPCAREMLEPTWWDKLECTPHARYFSESDIQHKKSVPGAPAHGYSNYKFDHYKIPRGEQGKALMKEQYFPGGKHVHEQDRRKDNLIYHHPQPYYDKLNPDFSWQYVAPEPC